ncbi:MAG: ArsC family reductase [Mariprofundaceae bacterium]|nr:ArsC family reductase [Mariprofundaceae bacterium]
MDIHLYGIPNCDSIRKARQWLKAQNIDYMFHDFKKEGIDQVQLTTWCATVSWEVLLNKRGMMWRKLSNQEKQAIDGEAAAITLMCRIPTIIKRPILCFNGQVHVAFTADKYEALLK